MSLVGVLTLIVLGAFGTGYWFAAWRYREQPVRDHWFSAGVSSAYRMPDTTVPVKPTSKKPGPIV